MRSHRESFLIFVFGLALTLASTEASVNQAIKLSSSYYMPVVGLGTWQMKPSKDVDTAITAALDNGYRHIDTAFLYKNEEAIGQSLKKYFDKGGKREDLFITSKLPLFGNSASDVEELLKLSLEYLGLQYIDLYLIHGPVGFEMDKSTHDFKLDKDGKGILDFKTDLIALWKAMEDQVKAGRVKSIGLSNFNESQILRIIQTSEIKPSNLQIELHVYHQQRPLRKLCAEHNISVTAYSSLGSVGSIFWQGEKGKKFIKPIDNPVVKSIAQSRNKSSAQILLRHQLQGGIIIIPKSVHPNRIKENINIFDFELTDDEMKQLDELDKGDDGILLDFNFVPGLETHPEYPFHKLKKQ